MPRTRSLAMAELKLGIISVISLALAGLLIFAVGGGGFFWQRYPLKAAFPNVATVKSGSPVRVAGITSGAVSQVTFNGTTVEVWLDVSKEVRPLITTESVAIIGSISLLGEGAIDIMPASTGTPLADWAYIPTAPTPGSIADLTERASGGLASGTALLNDMRTGRGTLGKLFTDETLYRDIDAMVRSAERVTTMVAKGEGTVGRLATNPALARDLEASVRDLRALTARIRNGEGSIGQLLTDPALSQSLTSAAGDMAAITRRLERGDGTAGRLLTDDGLYVRLDELTRGLDELTRKLNSPEGTAGRLLEDDALYENMRDAVADVRLLIRDIRNDPKRYLNVKVSLF